MTELTRPALEFVAEQARQAVGPHQAVQAIGVAVPHLILAVGEKMENVEKLQDKRARFRGQLTTISVDDFCDYTKEHDGEDDIPEVFVDGEKMTATAFFNLGIATSAGHGDDRAFLTLPKTGPYAALWGILDKTLNQKTLAEFLEDWRAHIRAFSEYDENAGLNPMPLGKAIAAVRNVTVESRQQQDSSVGDFKAEKTALESVEARSQNVLPPYLEFETEPYMSLPRRQILLRVSVVTGNGIGFIVRMVRQPDVLEAIAQDFKERLAAGLGEDATLTVGTFTLGT